MSSIEERLSPGEQILVKTKPAQVDAITLGILLGLFLILTPLTDLPNIAWAFYGLAVVGSLLTFKKDLGTEFALTNQNIIFKTGAFTSLFMVFPLKDLDRISIGQSFLGRRFNYGTIMFRIHGKVREFRTLPDPQELKEQIERQIEIVRKKPAE